MGATSERCPVDHSPDQLAMWYAQVERDYGALVTPLLAHSPAPGLLPAAWRVLRATMVTEGLVDRTTKEAVAAAVAHANSCGYWEELHMTVLESLNRRRPADSELTTRADHRISQTTAWARQPETARPFDDQHVPELVGTVVVSHYLNRVAMVLCAAESAEPSRFEAIARRAHDAPGADTDTWPDTPLPAGFGWAAGRPAVASAFAYAATMIDAAGRRAVPESVRAMLLDGDSCEPDDLPPDDRLAGRLASQTASAPDDVDPLLLPAWRARAGERAAVELVCWASFVRARLVGERLAPVRPARDTHRVLPFRPTGGPRRRMTTRRRRSGG
jgi:hypothetical protein